MTLAVTPIYAALLALLLIVLSTRVVMYRRQNRVDIGDQGHPRLQRLVRAQANFIEYVPITILLLGMLELAGASAAGLHTLGTVLFLARLAHGFGLVTKVGASPGRVVGVLATFSVIIVSAVWLLALTLRGGV